MPHTSYTDTAHKSASARSFARKHARFTYYVPAINVYTTTIINDGINQQNVFIHIYLYVY